MLDPAPDSIEINTDPQHRNKGTRIIRDIRKTQLLTPPRQEQRHGNSKPEVQIALIFEWINSAWTVFLQILFSFAGVNDSKRYE